MRKNRNEGRSYRARFRYFRQLGWYRPEHKKMVGEAVREIGILVLVFVPLEILLRSGAAPSLNQNAGGWRNDLVILFFLIAGITLIAFGIKIQYDAELELRRDSGQGPVEGSW